MPKRLKKASHGAPRWKWVLGTTATAIGLHFSSIGHFSSHSRPTDPASAASQRPISITVSGHDVAIGQMYGGQIIVGSNSPRDRSDCPCEKPLSSDVRKAPVRRIDRPHRHVTQINRNVSLLAENVEIGPPKPARIQLARDKEPVRDGVAFQAGPSSPRPPSLAPVPSTPVYSASTYSAYTGSDHGPFMEMGFPPFNTYSPY